MNGHNYMQRESGRLSLFLKIKKVLAVRMRNEHLEHIDAIQINVLTIFFHYSPHNSSYSGSFELAIGLSERTQLHAARKRSLELIFEN